MVSNPARNGPSRRRTLKLFGSGLAAVGLGASTGLAQSDATSTGETASTSDAQPASDASVAFEDQSPHYRTVYVEEVTLPDDGFLALHDASFFVEGPVVGVSAPLPAGTYTNLPVELDELPDEPLSVAAIPHQDTPSDGVFTHPNDGDTPYIGEYGVVNDTATIRPE